MIRTLTAAILSLLIACPAGAQSAAMLQLQRSLDASQTDNPGAVYDASRMRSPSPVYAGDPGEEDLAPAIRRAQRATPTLAVTASQETLTAAEDLKKKTAPDGKVDIKSAKATALDPETCEGFFKCMGASLAAPFVVSFMLGLAFGSAGVIIGDEKAGTFGMIVGGFLGALYGLAYGFLIGVVDMFKGFKRAFGQLF